ncbi:16320_t:CDS:2 [Entrophospora sp. SA101]|nr:16320_t:CDS:2 [Entrophospora sp. SA101]
MRGCQANTIITTTPKQYSPFHGGKYHEHAPSLKTITYCFQYPKHVSNVGIVDVGIVDVGIVDVGIVGIVDVGIAGLVLLTAAYIADAGIVDGGESSNNVVLYHNNAVNGMVYR